MFVLAGFTAFILTFSLALVALWLFPKLGLMDRPQKYGLTRESIPYYGGLVMVLAFALCILLFVPWSPQLLGVLLGLSLIVIVSFLDDMFMVHPFVRLGVQSFAAIIVALSGVGIRSITNPFGGVFLLDQLQFSFLGQPVLILSLIFTVIWIVFVVNSMNFFDGVPGLLSGVSFIASLVLFLLSLRTGHIIDQTQLVYLSSILVGICGAFVLFDFPVPKILMGDTGSMFLGFLLAVSAMFAGGKIATVLIVLGIPLLDAVWSTLRRIFHGQSPFHGDLNHLHHRLLRAGLSERQVVLIMIFMSAVFGFITLFLQAYGKMLTIGAIVFAMLLISLLLFFRHGSRSRY